MQPGSYVPGRTWPAPVHALTSTSFGATTGPADAGLAASATAVPVPATASTPAVTAVRILVSLIDVLLSQRPGGASACKDARAPGMVNGSFECRSRAAGGAGLTSGQAGAALLLARQRPQHVLHDAAMPEVLGLARSIDAHDRAELLVASPDGDLARHVTGIDRLDPGDVEYLVSGQVQRGSAVPRAELQRQHAHSDQVGPVDPLERLDQDGADAEQRGALRSPVPR